MAESATAGSDSGDDTDGAPLGVYEWGGGIVAGLGFFLTPVVAGPPAIYCALKVQDEKPLAAAGIGAVVLATILFWFGFLFGEDVIALFAGEGASAPVIAAILVVPVVVFLAVLVAR